ncbi:MAG: OmpA family protein [Gammaproteobacteria bacterium]|nr:OmpA family protein [Gammaproteobacteria bacterium]
MKKGIVLFALASGLAVLSSHSAMAGNRAGAITVTPGVGYYYFDDKRNLDDTGLGNIGLAYNLSDKWAIEAIYAPFNTNRTNITAGTPKHVHGNLYMADGLYRFYNYKMFEPYVSGGIGAMYLSRSGNDANTLANVHAAIGTQVFFDRVIALRGEVRDLYTLSGGKNDVMINFGVSVLFGGETPQPVVVYKDTAYKGDQ